MIRVLSLGAGVQSSAAALMIACGEIEMVDCGIFADTQNEPASVYRWLDWLEKQVPFPVIRVTRGNLAEATLQVRIAQTTGLPYLRPAFPCFLKAPDGSVGMWGRQCTVDYKISMVRREARKRMKAAGKSSVNMIIGMSLDEVFRMKPSPVKYIKHDYPLIDKRMYRLQCSDWVWQRYGKRPPKSACRQCPYRDDAGWMYLRANEPEEFEEAAEYEAALQKAAAGVLDGVPYLHDSCVPLREVVFDSSRQAEAFNNECAGMCGA